MTQKRPRRPARWPPVPGTYFTFVMCTTILCKNFLKIKKCKNGSYGWRFLLHFKVLKIRWCFCRFSYHFQVWRWLLSLSLWTKLILIDLFSIQCDTKFWHSDVRICINRCWVIPLTSRCQILWLISTDPFVS